MSPTQTTEKAKSAGPRTPEGKARSSMNALRHGLTGRVVVMPYEDLNAYKAFCVELMKDLAPQGPLETQFAQTFCDTQWRLNRIRSIEDSLFALGHFDAPGEIDTTHPEVHAALTAARVFRADSKVFANLSLYEQRLNRTLKEALRQLHELQAKRKAEAKAEAQKAADQFVISKPPCSSGLRPEVPEEARTLPLGKRSPFDNVKKHSFHPSRKEPNEEHRDQIPQASRHFNPNSDPAIDLLHPRPNPEGHQTGNRLADV